jgi:hypothetical protein
MGGQGLRATEAKGFAVAFFGPPTAAECKLGDSASIFSTLDRDPAAVNPHDAAGDRQVVREHLDLVGFGGVQLDDWRRPTK